MNRGHIIETSNIGDNEVESALFMIANSFNSDNELRNAIYSLKHDLYDKVTFKNDMKDYEKGIKSVEVIISNLVGAKHEDIKKVFDVTNKGNAHLCAGEKWSTDFDILYNNGQPLNVTVDDKYRFSNYKTAKGDDTLLLTFKEYIGKPNPQFIPINVSMENNDLILQHEDGVVEVRCKNVATGVDITKYIDQFIGMRRVQEYLRDMEDEKENNGEYINAVYNFVIDKKKVKNESGAQISAFDGLSKDRDEIKRDTKDEDVYKEYINEYEKKIIEIKKYLGNEFITKFKLFGASGKDVIAKEAKYKPPLDFVNKDIIEANKLAVNIYQEISKNSFNRIKVRDLYEKLVIKMPV